MKKSLITIMLVFAASSAFGDCHKSMTIDDVSTPSVKCIETFHDLMSLTYHYGDLVGFPETIQAILLQETQGGRIRTKSHHEVYKWVSYGVMQIQPETAEFILEYILKKKNIPERYILKIMLKTNDNFNIHLATVYFKYLFNKYVSRGNHPGVAWRMAVLAYNVGPGKLQSHGLEWDPNDYLDGIRKNLKIVREYNKAYNL